MEGPKIHLGHQEVVRVMDVAEEIYHSTPLDWLPQEPICIYMLAELGYEDVGELEDALGGTFDEFCQSVPNFHRRVQPGSDPPILEFRVDAPPPPDHWAHRRHTVHVTRREDLWRVIMRPPDSTVFIPELEFQIGASNTRVTDSIFHHIGTAIFNLGSWVQSQRSVAPEAVDRVSETIGELNALLDVERPWTFVIDDPRGYSTFLPAEGVETTDLPPEPPRDPVEGPGAA